MVPACRRASRRALRCEFELPESTRRCHVCQTRVRVRGHVHAYERMVGGRAGGILVAPSERVRRAMVEGLGRP